MVKTNMAAVGTKFTNTPANGKWIWKEETHSLEYISTNPNADRQDRRRDGRGRQQRGIHFQEMGHRRERGGTATIAGRGQFNRHGLTGHKSSKAANKSAVERTHVTLDDVKDVARNMMAEVDNIHSAFDAMYMTEQFDHFLLCLLNYFHWFFEKIGEEQKPNPMNIEPSLREKAYFEDLCAKLAAAQKLLGSAYCVLVLGVGMDKHHHMACGRDRVSSTSKDRSMYETLYAYCSFFVWIAFKRKEYEIVKRELGRMLRSETFNPAIRVKNASESDVAEDEAKEKKEKLTPAEYRRLHGKRPAIKSIINQRSPALVSILPSPKEDAQWLFRRSGALSPRSLGSIGKADIDEDDEGTLQFLNMDMSKLKIGIIGEQLSLFNPVTLTPVGADNEEEENEDAEKNSTSRKESLLPPHPKTPQMQEQAGISRQVTAISTATTEALSDEDD